MPLIFMSMIIYTHLFRLLAMTMPAWLHCRNFNVNGDEWKRDIWCICVFVCVCVIQEEMRQVEAIWTLIEDEFSYIFDYSNFLGAVERCQGLLLLRFRLEWDVWFLNRRRVLNGVRLFRNWKAFMAFWE